MTGLKKIRREMGMNQHEFSEYLGISFHTLKSYDNGDRDLSKASYADLKDWASKLNVSIEYLVNEA